MSDLSQQEMEMFYEAASRADPALRRAYLDRLCAGNAALRVRIEALLAVQADADRFFADAAAWQIPLAGEEEVHQLGDRNQSNP